MLGFDPHFQVPGEFPQLLQRTPEVLHDLLGDMIRGGSFGVRQTLIVQQEDVQVVGAAALREAAQVRPEPVG